MGPQVGPMSSNHSVHIVFKSLTGGDKKKLSFEISEQTIGWTHKITNFDSTGSTIHILMPACSILPIRDFLVSIIVYYEGEQIYESPYLYDADLDRMYILFTVFFLFNCFLHLIVEKLHYFNINKPTEADADPTTSYSTDDSNRNLVTNSHSLSTISKTKSGKNCKKRQREN